MNEEMKGFRKLVAKQICEVLDGIAFFEDGVITMDVCNIDDMVCEHVRDTISVEEAEEIVLNYPNMVAKFIAVQCRTYGYDYNGVELLDIRFIASAMMFHACGGLLCDLLDVEYGSELTEELKDKIINLCEEYIIFS